MVKEEKVIVGSERYELVYEGFHGKCANMHMRLNGANHIYTDTVRMHMMIYDFTLKCAYMLVLCHKS
jgi:hypothetical protein